MSLKFADQSREIIDALDHEEVTETPVGPAVYETNFFVRHSLGKFALDNGDSISLGLELPKRRCSARMLFLETYVQMGLLTQDHPDMLRHVPSLIGAVSFEDKVAYRPEAALVEDVSGGKRHSFHPRPASDELISLIEGLQVGSVNNYAPNALTTAEVEGQEKIVQFFPAPVVAEFDSRKPLEDASRYHQEGLTIVMDEGSQLAESLQEIKR